jgi:hypothetical protein
MKTFIIALLIGATLAMLGFVALRPSSQPTYADLQRAQLAAEQAQTLAPIWTLAQALLILGIPVLLLGALGVALWKFFRRPSVVRPDSAGRLPAVLAAGTDYQSVAIAALSDYHATERTRAGIAPVPHSLSTSTSTSYHHAPRIDYRHERTSVPEQLTQYTLPDLEAAITLTLPEVVRLADMLPTVPSGHLAYGMLTSGELLTLPLADGYHALFHGDTRSGKTNAIDSVIVQLHHQPVPVRLVLGDFKRELAATWRRSSKVEAVETEPQHIAEMLQEMVHGDDGILQRYSLFERVASESGRVIRNLGEYQRVTRSTLRQTFVVVDELNAVIAAAGSDKTLERSLQVALQTGAGAGCYLLSGAQYLDAKTFGRSGSKQFVTRAHFGSYDQTAQRMIFNGAVVEDDQKVLLDGGKGRGLIKVVGQPTPVAFQALRCDEGDILEAISDRSDLVREGSPWGMLADSGEQIEPGNAERTAPEREKPGFSYTREQAEIVRRLKSKGKGKAEIVEIVFNATKGGGPRYKLASGWYDQIVAGGAL